MSKKKTKQAIAAIHDELNAVGGEIKFISDALEDLHKIVCKAKPTDQALREADRALARASSVIGLAGKVQRSTAEIEKRIFGNLDALERRIAALEEDRNRKGCVAGCSHEKCYEGGCDDN